MENMNEELKENKKEDLNELSKNYIPKLKNKKFYLERKIYSLFCLYT